MRVRERGAGITEACGTGACAAAVAAQPLGPGRPRRSDGGNRSCDMDGGDAEACASTADGELVLTGPATDVATHRDPTHDA